LGNVTEVIYSLLGETGLPTDVSELDTNFSELLIRAKRKLAEKEH